MNLPYPPPTHVAAKIEKKGKKIVSCILNLPPTKGKQVKAEMGHASFHSWFPYFLHAVPGTGGE